MPRLPKPQEIDDSDDNNDTIERQPRTNSIAHQKVNNIQPAAAKKPRSPAQIAQFEKMREKAAKNAAKRIAQSKREKANSLLAEAAHLSNEEEEEPAAAPAKSAPRQRKPIVAEIIEEEESESEDEPIVIRRIIKKKNKPRRQVIEEVYESDKEPEPTQEERRPQIIARPKTVQPVQAAPAKQGFSFH